MTERATPRSAGNTLALAVAAWVVTFAYPAVAFNTYVGALNAKRAGTFGMAEVLLALVWLFPLIAIILTVRWARAVRASRSRSHSARSSV